MKKCFVIALLSFVACTSKTSYPDITIKTTEVTGVVGRMKTTYTFNKLGGEYLQLKLVGFDTGGHYGVKQDIISQNYDKDSVHQKWMEIVDIAKPEEMLEFKQPQVFSNFMAAHGYDVVDQNKSNDHIDYTFKMK